MLNHRLCLAALLIPCAGVAGAADLPPAAAFFNEPSLHMAVLSPHGRYVATLNARASGGQVLAIVDTADPGKITAPVEAKGGDRIFSIHWINENRIGFSMKEARIAFSGNGNADEFAVNRDGTELTRLISGDWDWHQDVTGSSIRDRTLTADYTFSSTTHDGSDDIIVQKLIFNNVDAYAQSSHLLRLNTKTRMLSELRTGADPANVYQWMRDADGIPVLALSRIKGRCVIAYRPREAPAWKDIANTDCYDGQAMEPQFFDANGTLTVSATHEGHSALFTYDLKTLQLAKQPYLSIAGFDFDGHPERDLPSKKVLGIHFNSDANTTVWFDPKFKQWQADIDAALPATSNSLSCGDDCLNASVLLVRAESDRQPARSYLYTVASKTLLALGSSHPAIVPSQMGLRDFHHFAARDGMSIPVYVTLPPGKASAPRPAVVLVHGGPNVRGSSWEWEAEAQFLATRGYVVIQPEFRGSTGFGTKHFKAGWKQWGLGMQDDLADAAAWAVKQGWADPKRVAIMGASYGGYATLMGLIKHPEVFRCGVEWAGVSDITLMFTSGQSDATRDSLAYDMKTLIGDPDTDAALFAQNSPLQMAARLRQPLLMAHGMDDHRVPLEHAVKFRDAVRATNKQIEWITYADEGHGWRHVETQLDFWQRVEAFLDKNLKNAP
ncbi:MAG: alpha/beta fold hydrolase [Pseudomonadota bacterium]